MVGRHSEERPFLLDRYQRSRGERRRRVLRLRLEDDARRRDPDFGELRPDGAAVLLANRARLAHLASIDLRRTGMSSADATALAAALPNARLEAKPIQLPEFFFRYVSSME